MNRRRRPLLLRVVLVLALASSLALALTSVERPPLRFFIGGLGYCGSRLAARLRNEFPDCTISGTVRSQTRKQSILADRLVEEKCGSNLRVHVLDLDENYVGLDQEGQRDLTLATHVVQTVAPIADFDRDPLLALHGKILHESNSDLQWVGYLSSTGVYGDHGGNWVDEDSNLNCKDAKSLARIEAEKEWRRLEEARWNRNQKCDTRVDCFRCGGIYGPGRGPLNSVLLSSSGASLEDIADLSKGREADVSTPTKYVNRILVDDICGALVAAIKANLQIDRRSPGKIYNLVDDDPAPRRSVMAEAQRLVAGSAAETTNVGNVDGARPSGSGRRPVSRNTGNKRCRNQRLKEDYGCQLVAPTYREGLALLLEQEIRKQS
jgi:nucleoside-diphosphate-sugar epimerase